MGRGRDLEDFKSAEETGFNMAREYQGPSGATAIAIQCKSSFDIWLCNIYLGDLSWPLGTDIERKRFIQADIEKSFVGWKAAGDKIAKIQSHRVGDIFPSAFDRVETNLEILVLESRVVNDPGITISLVPAAVPAGDEDERAEVVEVYPIPGYFGKEIDCWQFECEDYPVGAGHVFESEREFVHINDGLILFRVNDHADDSRLLVSILHCISIDSGQG